MVVASFWTEPWLNSRLNHFPALQAVLAFLPEHGAVIREYQREEETAAPSPLLKDRSEYGSRDPSGRTSFLWRTIRTGVENMAATLEERVAELEAEVARLKRRLEPEAKKPWWEERIGAFADDPMYDEAMRLGREYRESLRPPDYHQDDENAGDALSP